ncbi:MAG: helix-turn-helix transcriptional regulator [Deltaproteobacteria bacterium]|nr:helix-turn-helix transcriptional regulator [Deltaproteobacteria bacterium]
MDFTATARQLAALGHAHRLELFYLLVRAGHDGMTVGEIHQAMQRPTSTVTFHLRELVAAGLVSQERAGRSVRCRAEFAVLGAVLDDVRTACCSNAPARRRKVARP